MAEKGKAVCEADGGSRLPLPRGRRRDGCDENELAVLPLTVHDGEIDLGLIFAVVLDLVLGEADLLCDFEDMLQFCRLCDLDIRLHTRLLISTKSITNSPSVCQFLRGKREIKN